MEEEPFEVLNHFVYHPNHILVPLNARYYEIGKVINASFPVSWQPYLRDPEGLLLKYLMNWILKAEKEAFAMSETLDVYHDRVGELINHAVDDTHIVKTVLTPWASVDEDSPFYNITQLIANMFNVCKLHNDMQISEWILYVTCGMMNVPEPLPCREQLMHHNHMEHRRRSIFRLLKWTYPEPTDDGKEYVTHDILDFGAKVEEGIHSRSRTRQQYHERLQMVRDKLTEMRREEEEFHAAFEVKLSSNCH
ncbi:Protein CBG05651 [Caenorhabditis briggsae]|uniref:Protein CBG05651 n=1 Tax=Caenorhabditis briggsae TaxID=6238 RepID=A8X0C8_CAEBR|nr:Protein CBG05651 [Caenorhabditis briggsae]CAP26088.2 Protein CBG05651 [Caenorhabditis briggsae]